VIWVGNWVARGRLRVRLCLVLSLAVRATTLTSRHADVLNCSIFPTPYEKPGETQDVSAAWAEMVGCHVRAPRCASVAGIRLRGAHSHFLPERGPLRVGQARRRSYEWEPRQAARWQLAGALGCSCPIKGSTEAYWRLEGARDNHMRRRPRGKAARDGYNRSGPPGLPQACRNAGTDLSCPTGNCHQCSDRTAGVSGEAALPSSPER
jgi:hypothetical protein